MERQKEKKGGGGEGIYERVKDRGDMLRMSNVVLVRVLEGEERTK